MVCRTNDCNGFRAVVFSGFYATLVATLVMSKLSFRWIVGDWSKAQIPDILLFTPYAIGVGVLFFCRAFRSHQQTVLVSFLEPGRGVDGWQSPVDCSGLLSRRTSFWRSASSNLAPSAKYRGSLPWCFMRLAE